MAYEVGSDVYMLGLGEIGPVLCRVENVFATKAYRNEYRLRDLATGSVYCLVPEAQVAPDMASLVGDNRELFAAPVGALFLYLTFLRKYGMSPRDILEQMNRLLGIPDSAIRGLLKTAVGQATSGLAEADSPEAEKPRVERTWLHCQFCLLTFPVSKARRDATNNCPVCPQCFGFMLRPVVDPTKEG